MKNGGVGVSLAGRTITIRPHNRQVTRTLLMGKSNPGVLSAALDGTVRMTDLVRQSVCLEYSWDQSFSGKQGVRWLEEREVYSFLLDCDGEINQIDIRSKEAAQLFELSKDQAYPPFITNLSVNPTNKNLLSLCRDSSLQIWDLRKASGAVVTLPGPGGSSMAGGGWSLGGSYLVSCVQGGYSRDMVVVYNGLDFSQPILTWEGPRKMTLSPPSGITWCPWQESVFLTTMEQVRMSSLEMKPKHCVVAVHCISGSIVGELCAGLDSSNYMLHCSKAREVVVVGNTKGPGGMAVYKGN